MLLRRGRRGWLPKLRFGSRRASARSSAVLCGLKRDGRLPECTRHLRGRWFKDRVEQDHRRVERRARAMPRFRSSGSPRHAAPWPASRPWPCWRRGRCAPYVRRTARCSAPSFCAFSASLREPGRRRGARRPTEANAREIDIRMVTLATALAAAVLTASSVHSLRQGPLAPSGALRRFARTRHLGRSRNKRGYRPAEHLAEFAGGTGPETAAPLPSAVRAMWTPGSIGINSASHRLRLST